MSFSTTIACGGPAFPWRLDVVGPVQDPISGKPVPEGRTEVHIMPGMTLRDYLAGQALAGVAANPSSGCNSPSDLAHWAYQCADAMLRERAK